MTQRDRDRLVIVKQADERKITQREAAGQLRLSLRQVQRLVKKFREVGDEAVLHGLRGRLSNRRVDQETRGRVIEILSQPLYTGFGPTLASEYLAAEHQIELGRETVRQLMTTAGLWQVRARKVAPLHTWRPRRSCCGELVQWDTSDHDWLEGRGVRVYLIAMIDDATSRAVARFALHDTTAENMLVLELYLNHWGRFQIAYTDKASMFHTPLKRAHDGEPQEAKPTQIGRALRELGIVCQAAHSPQAKGRIERFFGTSQDRLVKGMRMAGVGTLTEANRYLEQVYLPLWNERFTVEPANPTDAHRALLPEHNLVAILSHVETRRVTNDYTIRFQGQLYQIDRREVRTGLRGANVRVEQRRDGTIAVRFREHYLAVHQCQLPVRQPTATAPVRRSPAQRGSDWMANFDLKKSMPVWKAAQYPAVGTTKTDRR